MPELPEVETIRRGLDSVLPGKQILTVRIDTPKLVQPPPAIFSGLVTGRKIIGVSRRAKIIQINLEKGISIFIHLKLTGRLLFRPSGAPVDEWQHVVLGLSGNTELRFCDLRKFGWLKAIKAGQVEKEFADYGPEPLGKLTETYFLAALASTRRAVKVLLMDQRMIGGVGNIYANEALFLAGIDPRRPANSLTAEEGGVLFRNLEKVIQAGLDYRGASDNHYLDAFGKKGHYQEHFLVYGRQGKACWQCDRKIERVVVGGRGTFICRYCQGKN